MKISVVVPVFNAERFISRCVESVLNQTYSDWELIVVDDGSNDGSWDILKEYEKKDARIKLLYQKNSGAGSARNLALKNIDGEYVVFLDVDDYLSENYFDLLSKHNEDIVFIDVRTTKRDKKSVIEKMSKYSNLTKDDFIRAQITGKIDWAGWRKASKSKLIKAHDINYSTHTVGEEAIFSFKLLQYAETIGFIDFAVYNHELRSDSLSQTKLEDPWGEVALSLRDQIKDMGLYDCYAETLNAFIFTTAIVSIDKLAHIYERKIYKQKTKDRIEKLNFQLDKSKKIDKKHMDKKALLMMPFVKLKAVSLIRLISKIRRKI